MKSAIIGLGVIGKVHFDILSKMNVDISCLCDIDENKFIKDFPENSLYTDYIRMLDENDIDVVHICTPHYLHCEMIEACLRRNINVLCEKPLCISREQLRRIEDALNNSEAQLGICFQNRYNESSIMMKKILEKEKIISMDAILEWNRDEKYYLKSLWRGNKKESGGGVLINQAIHTLDLLTWFSSIPTKIEMETSKRRLSDKYDIEDTITLKSDIYSLYATVASDRDNPVVINIKTDKADYRLRNNSLLKDGKAISLSNTEVEGRKKVYGNGHDALIQDFYDCVENRKKFPIDYKEAKKTMEIVFKAYESANN